jgi:hypothetical protein
VDVHLPGSIRTWKDFLLHLLTITIGLFSHSRSKLNRIQLTHDLDQLRILRDGKQLPEH